MSEDNESMQVEFCSEYYQSTNEIKPKSYGGPKQDERLEMIDNSDSRNEKEPLFVIDRTQNFRLNHAIQFESSASNQNNYGRNNSTSRSDMGSRQNSCWNCSSTNHSLHNCPEPRNHRIINTNRQMFLMQKQQQQQQYANYQNIRNRPGGRRNVRYFVSGNKSPYSKFTPGKLSNDLLEALGVPENGIPLHVYRMRQFGYPTGWLEEAKEEYSGISIFTEPNKCLPLPGRENEENIFYCNINENKLHEYPGFNAPCSSNVVDEFKAFNCPEYNPEQSIKNMVERLKFKKELTKLPKDGIALIETQTQLQSTNSKIVEENKSIDPPSSPEDGEITEDEEIKNDSFNSDKCNESNEILPENSIELSDTAIESFNETKDSINNTKSNLSNSNSENDASASFSNLTESSASISSSRHFGDIKSEVLGTPVLKRFSTYENRPNHANFAKGMVDLIDHENLPNAVGTFKKLKEILKDVRTTLNNLLH